MHAASRADSTDSARSPLDSDPDIDEDFLASTRTLAANLEGEDDLSLLETEDDASSIASDPSSDLNQAAGANEADEDNPYTEVMYRDQNQHRTTYPDWMQNIEILLPFICRAMPLV